MPATSSRNAESDNEEAVGPVTAATDRLVATAATFDSAALTAPSLCPGWTRAHVLAHLARNADALTNLLSWARTGVETLAYPSREARQEDIDAGATRSADELVTDIKEASARLSSAVADLPADAWQHEVRLGPGGAGKAIPARRVLWARLQEVEVHHVDLDMDYMPHDWPEIFVRRALAETVRGFAQRDDVPEFTLVIDGAAARVGSGGQVTVAGSARPVLAWLLGRSSGSSLQTKPAGSLPRLPAWL